MYTETHQQSIRDILRVCGLSFKEASAIHSHLSFLEANNGMKFAVGVLKERFQALLDPKADKFLKHRDGTWRGPWRPVKRLSLRGRKGFRKALRITKMYGLFRAEDPTLSDYGKHGYNISSNPEHKFSALQYGLEVSLFRKAVRRHYKQTNVGLFKEFDNTASYPLRSTRAPISWGYSIAEVLMTPADHIRCLENCPRLVILHYQYLYGIVGESLPSLKHFLKLERTTKQDVVGTMTLLTKDRGLKMRAVVNPFRIVQLACTRLESTLYAYLKKNATVWVYDQAGGAEWVVSQLQQGKRLSSIDLRAASDNIPLVPQLALAEALFPWLRDSLAFFGDVNRAHWWTPFEGVNLKYTRGHGMGVRGSFPLFTTFLLHGLLVSGRGKKDFAIVGDDMVMDEAQQDILLKYLEIWGIPINETKSLFRSNIAEFVGRILDQHGSLEVYKASPLDINYDPLGLVRQYGKSAFRKTSLREYVRNGLIKRLQFYLELSSSDRRSLSTGLESRKDRQFLAGHTPVKLSSGAPPLVLLEWYFSHGSGKIMKEHQIQAMNTKRLADCKVNEDYVFRSKILQDELTKTLNAFRDRNLGPCPRFKFDVISWKFPHNEQWKLDAFSRVERNNDYSSADAVFRREAQEREIAEFLGLSAQAPDSEKSYEDAVNRIKMDHDKYAKWRLLKESKSLVYVNKLVRLFKKAFRTIGRSFKENHE